MGLVVRTQISGVKSGLGHLGNIPVTAVDTRVGDAVSPEDPREE